MYVNTCIIFPLWSWSHCNSLPCRFATPLHIETAFTGLSAWSFHLGLIYSNLLALYTTYNYLQNCCSLLLKLGPEALLLMHSSVQVSLKFLSYWSTIFLNVSIKSAFSPFHNCSCFYINIFYSKLIILGWLNEALGSQKQNEVTWKVLFWHRINWNPC